MDKAFYQYIFEKQREVEAVPQNENIALWVLQLICLLYPEWSERFASSLKEIEEDYQIFSNGNVKAA